jgi:hypothetical protein
LVATYSVLEFSTRCFRKPDAVRNYRFYWSTTQEVLLRYMICVGLVQPDVTTLRTSILISNGDRLVT